MKVIVVGAGLAGLYSGLLLESRGHSATVVEASNRVGGRVWSAVPLGQLMSLQLDFALPPLMARALSNRVMGHAAKLSGQLQIGSSPRGVQSASGWWSWNPLRADADSSVAAVTAFAGGLESIAQLGVNDGIAKWADELKASRPDLAFDTGTYYDHRWILTDWSRQQWINGAYSSAGLGWEPDLDEAFVRPVGRVALGGEHTGGRRRGMNAALHTGARAANAIEILT